jgi:hypothetical protein
MKYPFWGEEDFFRFVEWNKSKAYKVTAWTFPLTRKRTTFSPILSLNVAITLEQCRSCARQSGALGIGLFRRSRRPERVPRFSCETDYPLKFNVRSVT